MPIPDFRADGYLPVGLHAATEPEVIFRFGSSTRRRRLALRVRRWLDLARAVHAAHFLLDGSFVTAKEEPRDVDAVLRLPADFDMQYHGGGDAALELHHALTTRQPEELFAAEDDMDWQAWIEFFSRTREPDGRRKGLIEVVL